MARGAAAAGSRRNSISSSDEASAASLHGGRSSGNLRSLHGSGTFGNVRSRGWSSDEAADAASSTSLQGGRASDEAAAAASSTSLQGGGSSGNLRSLLLQGGGTSDSLPRSIRPMLHRFNLDAVERGASGGRIGDVVPSITIGSLLQR